MNLDARTAKKTAAAPAEGQILENGLLLPAHMEGKSKRWGRHLKEAWLYLVNGEFSKAYAEYEAMARLYGRGIYECRPAEEILAENPGLNMTEVSRAQLAEFAATEEEEAMASELYERHLKLAYRATGGLH